MSCGPAPMLRGCVQCKGTLGNHPEGRGSSRCEVAEDRRSAALNASCPLPLHAESRPVNPRRRLARLPTDETSRRTRGPVIATAIVVAQGLALVAFGVWLMVERWNETPSNESVYQGSTAYMFVTGALVLLVAVAARRGVGWAMGAAVFVQLLALAVTYEMAKEGFWAGAVPLGLASAVALLSLLSPSGRAAFGRS